MKPGAGIMATSLKLQAASYKRQATSFKLPDIIVLISSPEGARKSEKKLRQIVAGQYNTGRIVAGQSVMLTDTLTQEPGIRVQASSDKLRRSVIFLSLLVLI